MVQYVAHFDTFADPRVLCQVFRQIELAMGSLKIALALVLILMMNIINPASRSCLLPPMSSETYSPLRVCSWRSATDVVIYIELARCCVPAQWYARGMVCSPIDLNISWVLLVCGN